MLNKASDKLAFSFLLIWACFEVQYFQSSHPMRNTFLAVYQLSQEFDGTFSSSYRLKEGN